MPPQWPSLHPMAPSWDQPSRDNSPTAVVFTMPSVSSRRQRSNSSHGSRETAAVALSDSPVGSASERRQGYPCGRGRWRYWGPTAPPWRSLGDGDPRPVSKPIVISNIPWAWSWARRDGEDLSDMWRIARGVSQAGVAARVQQHHVPDAGCSA